LSPVRNRCIGPQNASFDSPLNVSKITMPDGGQQEIENISDWREVGAEPGIYGSTNFSNIVHGYHEYDRLTYRAHTFLLVRLCNQLMEQIRPL
jgi:hypothetical protein